MTIVRVPLNFTADADGQAPSTYLFSYSLLFIVRFLLSGILVPDSSF